MPARASFLTFVICVVCVLSFESRTWAQDATPRPKTSGASANSDDRSTPKPNAHRKKKPASSDDDDHTPGATPPVKSKKDSDSETTPAPKKKRVATEEEPKPSTPAAATSGANGEHAPHAPAASIETAQLTEFASQPSAIQQIIKAALDLTKLNLTYTFGSSDPASGGMDCSGTIYYLLRSQGLKDVPRDSSEQYVWARKNGQFFAVVSTDADSFEFKDLQPGDLMFWTGTYKTERAVPISHVMMYLGREKGSGKRVMFGSSDGRSYNGVQRWGVSVFDFKMPKGNPADPEKHVDFVGYAHIPKLRDAASSVQMAANAHPEADKAVPPPVTPTPQPRATPTPVPVVAKFTPAPATPARESRHESASPVPATPSQPPGPLHEPQRGTAERKAIMDALRADRFPDRTHDVIFQVNYLRVHEGWAWADVTPQDSKSGKPVESRSKALLRFDEGNWKVVDLGKLPLNGSAPVNSEFVKSISEAAPGVPADIFPRKRN
jgi:cell wall-associated NlpC family hydrolase